MTYIVDGQDPDVLQALRVIESTYGDTVSVVSKAKNLLKFGESQQVQTTKTTLMDLPTGVYNETYVADNLITHFSSSDAGDSGPMVVEYHTVDGSGNFTFGVQTVTLAGQTKTALTTPAARISRIYNDGSSTWAGTVYVYEDDTVAAGVPATGAKVHAMITAGKQNSSKGATTISSQDYWLVTAFTADVIEKAATFAEVHLEIRNKGKVFREVAHLTVSDDSGHVSYDFKPYVIVPPNSDVRLVGLADTANKYIGGTIDGYLGIVV